MSTPFEAKKGISDACRQARLFITINKEHLWSSFKLIAPYIIGLTILDILFDTFVFTVDENGKNIKSPAIGAIISSYFWACFVITWHRVVLHGADNYISVNPFKPKKSELAFIGTGILIIILAVIVGAFAGAILSVTKSPAIITVGLLILSIMAFIAGLRLSFYFPAKATGNDLTLKQAFRMSKGYAWNMFITSMWAPIKTMLLLILYFILGLIVVGILLVSLGGGQLITGLLSILFTLPILVFFNPILAAFGVTVVSNFYQHALQNRDEDEYK